MFAFPLPNLAVKGTISSAMSAADTAIVILAAGKGTRMRSELAKVLHRAGGRPLMEHVIRACHAAEGGAAVGGGGTSGRRSGRAGRIARGADTVLQQPQRGTGHAMQVARRAIRKRAKIAIVLPGDAPLLRTETLTALLDTHRRGEAAATILSAEIDDPTDYGRMVRDTEGRVEPSWKKRAATPEQRAIREVNSSIYCFTLDKLWPCLNALRPENAHQASCILPMRSLCCASATNACWPKCAPDAREILGCNTRAHLADVDRIFRARKAAELMDSGVTIYLPETVVIDPDVTAGPDTVIEPGVQLLGETRIGARARFALGACSQNVRVDDDVVIGAHSTLDSCRVGMKAQIGPFSRLRPGSDIRRRGACGKLCRVKNTVLQEGSKAPHLSYLGDASIGRDTNIGAGTITCNYDGVAKHHTTIGNRVFIGSDTALVAPVRMRRRRLRGGGFGDYRECSRGRAGHRARPTANKPGWAAARRKEIQRAAKSKSSAPARKSARRKSRSRAKGKSSRSTKQSKRRYSPHCVRVNRVVVPSFGGIEGSRKRHRERKALRAAGYVGAEAPTP